MKELFNTYFKEYQKISKTISPSIYASSLVYYFIIVLLPLFNLITYLLSLLNINQSLNNNIDLSGISVVIFLINVIYVASKIIYNLKKVFNEIYQKEDNHIFIISKIKSIITMSFLIILIICLIIAELYLHYLLKEVIMTYQIIANIFFIIIRFLMITLVLSFVLKQVIPVKIKLIETFKLSIIVTFISYFLIKCYQHFYMYFGTNSYQNLYGSLYLIFLFLVLLYLLFLVMIYVIIFEYLRYKIKKTEYTNYEHERGV